MEAVVRSFVRDNKDQADSEVGYVGWTEELETGIEVMDEQHRRYVELLNNYIAKASKKGTISEEENNQLTESRVFLRQYAKEHFATEESIMIDAEFPEFDAHKEEHSYFLRHVGKLCTELETTGFSPKLSREVNYYTIEWFIKHILLLDMQLVRFLKTRH